MEIRAYDYLIVLCPGDPRIENDEVILDDYDEHGYLGGTVRMQAAVKIASLADTLILVGGQDTRVKAMEKFVLDGLAQLSNTDVQLRVQMLVRNTTLGNLEVLKENLVLDGTKRVALLSNFYHIPRILKMAAYVFPSQVFVPLVAEAFVEAVEEVYDDRMFQRVKSEIKGIRDWEQGDYGKKV